MANSNTIKPRSNSSAPAPAAWRVWVEPWYLAYALLGATVAGIAPILLPISVTATGSLATVGLVMAAFNLGGLAAPVWGALADHRHVHRALLLGGLIATALAIGLFPFANSPIEWLILALIQGTGAAAAATVANLFVIESHPSAEWDERIGWLQTFYGGGQVAGLLVAGLLSQIDLRLAMLVAAGLTALGVIPAWRTVSPRRPLGEPRPTLLHPPRHVEISAGSPQRAYHILGVRSLREAGRIVSSRFSLFLIAWLVSFAGAAAFFSFYPVVMQHEYGVSPAVSSAGFALAAGLGLTLYTLAGRWSERLGALRVLRTALAVRVAAFVVLLAAGVLNLPARGGLALLSFAFVVLAWSLLSVGGTALTAQLSPVGEGEGMGVFNAATALAGVLGAGLGGVLAGTWGYAAIPAWGIAGVALGLLVLGLVRADEPNKLDDNKTPGTAI